MGADQYRQAPLEVTKLLMELAEPCDPASGELGTYGDVRGEELLRPV